MQFTDEELQLLGMTNNEANLLLDKITTAVNRCVSESLDYYKENCGVNVIPEYKTIAYLDRKYLIEVDTSNIRRTNYESNTQ